MADDIKLIIGVDSTPVKRAVQLLNNLESEFKDVKRAEEKGLITRKRASAETKRLTAEMARLRQVSNGSVASFKKFDKALSGSGKSARRNEIAFQQAGYQVQDFIVQVQAGTNPLIAFSQQGSQLAGFFAGPWGAMIGLGIAALSSLGMALIATSGKAKSFGDSIKETTGLVEEYFSLLDSKESFGEAGFGAIREQLQATSQAYRDLIAIAKVEALNSVTESIDALATSAKNTNWVLGQVGEVGNLLEIETQLKGNLTAFKENRKQVRLFIDSINELDSATSLEDQYNAAVKLKGSFLEVVGPLDDMNEEQKLFLKNLNLSIYQMELLGVATKAVGELNYENSKHFKKFSDLADADAKRRFKSVVEYNKVLKQRADFVESETAKQQDNIAVLSLQLKFGEDSLAVKRLIAQQEREAYEKSLERYQLGPKIKESLMAHYDTAKSLADELERAADAFGKVDLSPTEIKTGVRLGSLPPEALGDIPQSAAEKAAEKAYDAIRRRRRKKTTGGSGSDNVVNIKDIIAARELQMQQERSLIGLSEKQAAGQRVYYDLLKQNQDADVQLTETEIEGAARSIAAFEEQSRVLQEAVDKQEEIADTIASSMGDAFMSIVDGTKSAKDAFKDMAREIIKRLYEILVVEQLVQSISGTIKGAFSGSAAPATSPRPKIRPFADGGVLSGPTMFPMAGGKTGLMGEAGPEAIMPLKRGANGKLGVQMEGGGGDNVVIHQNFNFQANGDDSVKRIIAQAAPQIANMTKKSMLDDRRRGGQMKATFG